MTRMRKRGFTIVEMLMVIGVLAILMGIVTTAVSAAIRQARDRKTAAVKSMVQTGIATYRSQYDAWPPENDNASLNKWASEGIPGDRVNGVSAGRGLAFLSAEQYDKMVLELVKVSVGRDDASPVMDVTGLYVAQGGAASSAKGRGMEFREALRENKRHGASFSLSGAVFGYQTKDGYFRRFIVQYNEESDSVVVMTQDDYRSWWQGRRSGASLQWPTGYSDMDANL